MMPVGTTSGTPQVLLSHHLKQLKLPTVLREYDKPACECARDGVDRSRYLGQELIGWERRVVERRITEARFPAVKSLDTFDFSAIPSLNKMLVLELARGQFIRRRENVIALGNSGTGKTQSRSPLALPPTKVADNALHRGRCFDDPEAFTLRSLRFRGAGWHVESLDSNPLQAP
ncbi:ATP-binding protein (plasmid) [Nitrobacter sp. NHB1]